MEPDLRWMVGTGISVALAMVGVIVAAFRNLSNKITMGNSELHSRINDVKDKYVRRADLDGHIQRLERAMRDSW